MEGSSQEELKRKEKEWKEHFGEDLTDAYKETEREEWKKHFKEYFGEDFIDAYEGIERELAEERARIESAKIPKKEITVEEIDAEIDAEIAKKYFDYEAIGAKGLGTETLGRFKTATADKKGEKMIDEQPKQGDAIDEQVTPKGQPETGSDIPRETGSGTPPEKVEPSTLKKELQKEGERRAKRIAKELALLFVPDKIGVLAAKASGKLAVKGFKWLGILGLSPLIAIEEVTRMVPAGVMWKKIQKERQKAIAREISIEEKGSEEKEIDSEVAREMKERVKDLQETKKKLTESIEKARKRIHQKGLFLRAADWLQYSK